MLRLSISTRWSGATNSRLFEYHAAPYTNPRRVVASGVFCFTPNVKRPRRAEAQRDRSGVPSHDSNIRTMRSRVIVLLALESLDPVGNGGEAGTLRGDVGLVLTDQREQLPALALS